MNYRIINKDTYYRKGVYQHFNELICYDCINPTQYVFHDDTETCTPVCTNYNENYEIFY